jgi:hypothetical protein
MGLGRLSVPTQVPDGIELRLSEGRRLPHAGEAELGSKTFFDAPIRNQPKERSDHED